MSTPFDVSMTLADLFPEAGQRSRFELLSYGRTGLQLRFDGRGLRGQAANRVVLIVVPRTHPNAQRLIPDAKAKYVVIYDRPDRDDVAEEVESVEQLAELATEYAMLPVDDLCLWQPGQIKSFVKRAKQPWGTGWQHLGRRVQEALIAEACLKVVSQSARPLEPEDIDMLHNEMLDVAGVLDE